MSSSLYFDILSTRMTCLSQLSAANYSHNFPIKYCKNCKDSFVPGELTSCFLPVPLLEVAIYIKLQSSPVLSCFQLVQQPQLLPYCEIQSPFSKHIHYTEFFTTESLHYKGSFFKDEQSY